MNNVQTIELTSKSLKLSWAYSVILFWASIIGLILDVRLFNQSIALKDNSSMDGLTICFVVFSLGIIVSSILYLGTKIKIWWNHA